MDRIRAVAVALLLLAGGCSRQVAPVPRVKAHLPPSRAEDARPVAPAPPPKVVAKPVASRYPASLKPYRVSASLKEVSNLPQYRALKLEQAVRSQLARNLFACRPTDHKQLFQVYENNDYLDLPSFVTVDLVLQLFHVFYGYTLRTVEAQSLAPALEQLADEMRRGSLAQLRAAREPAIRDAALRNVAFAAVTAGLLGRRVALPPEAEAMVAGELRLVDAHEGWAVGAILPYKLDYSQFVPRGHYTRSDRLKRYFRAMMWLGLAPFAPRFSDKSPADGPLRQALLLSRTLNAPRAAALWQRIYEPTSFYVNTADDLTPAELSAAAGRALGKGHAVTAYAPADALAKVRAALDALRRPGIRARMELSPPYPDPDVQMRVMGQRYIPDSEAMQRLCAPIERPFPCGMDVMAVLGSPRAEAIIRADPKVFNTNGWMPYDAERAKLAAEFAALPAGRWSSSLYWSWLDCLREVTRTVPAGYPTFMRSSAWADRSLYSALGSWAELRHDTILYGKQSAVECGGGEEEKLPKGYVEPNAPLYDRLAALLTQTRQGLERRKLMPERLRDRFGEFESLVRFLRTCSLKELRNEALTEAEYLEIKYIGAKCEMLTLATVDNAPNTWDLVDEADRDMAIVADVHTATDLCLEVGVGRAQEILVIVRVAGKLTLTRGAIFSFHEFKHPTSDRLTDEKWRDLLKAGKAPTPPAWTRSFLTPVKPATGTELKGYSSGC
ncbi:MAG: DUF3160 domain-containing protein [Armatimonadetes bacterium]|nr:DUF3160 domain-containing protein [Armatimonadota bacterium]